MVVLVAFVLCALVFAGTVAALVQRDAASPQASPQPSPTSDPQQGPAPAAGSTPGGSSPAPASSPSPSVPPRTRPGSGPMDVEAVAGALEPAVVDITASLGSQARAAGTGMVISPSGEILTNNHVIAGALSITVQIAGSGRDVRAVLVGADVRQDVAVLQMQGVSGLRTIPLGDSSSVAVGDQVLALGNALGLAGPPSRAPGVVVALDQAITASDPTAGTSENLAGLVQTDARLQPGDSGGPLSNSAGQVIGMDTAASARMRLNASPVGGFAIPINRALSIAAALEAHRGPATAATGLPGYLGVQVATAVAPDGSDAGAAVEGVVAGGPAQAAGIQPGDVILSVNGLATTTADALTTLLAAHQAGDALVVQWLDAAGRTRTATIHLAPKPSG